LVQEEAEWSQTIRGHEGIAAAAMRLGVARAGGNAEIERLASTVQAHARTEENVNYPAGDSRR
jgi:hypothetical protein